MDIEGLPIRRWNHIDEPIASHRSGKVTIKIGPSFRFDLPFQCMTDFQIGAKTQFLGNQIQGTGAHAVADIVAGDNQIAAIFGNAAHDNMDVRMLGIPMISGGPVERGAEVLFHLPHQIAGKTFEVGHLDRVFRRDNEPKMVTVMLAARRKLVTIDVVTARPKQLAVILIAADPVALDVGEMGSQ
ncbi:hypothetical protein ATE69_13625 [Sphingopyxis sp. H071]|nr:hypothetical protein ATE61_14325 [Sphingopyxis sp. H057]KTE50387.1 hypothetical protein ATE64_16245 [Sphingopyxis sp. H073]KTE52476.1 hypothetical protein ATE69_13625 [Sphingopyxis sp. H071]KTE62969.1 hypothetical protein ATE66_01145 [Sphingopyxis sp. H107]KTE72201.1 hypothetical protein ATE60_10375 [Sphingopyxis sp. H081]KTE79732.1 hypothetical protein ATE63_13795 [Sphingopyxis sp. H067]